jgi:ABC-type polysaccharide/polyol phosphate export permease
MLARPAAAAASLPARRHFRPTEILSSDACRGMVGDDENDQSVTETDEFGLPVRHNWAAEYRGRAMVVYGHTPVPEPEWLNNTVDIDTGCVFGGRLTALRYPERTFVSVPAARVYRRRRGGGDRRSPTPQRPARRIPRRPKSAALPAAAGAVIFLRRSAGRPSPPGGCGLTEPPGRLGWLPSPQPRRPTVGGRCSRGGGEGGCTMGEDAGRTAGPIAAENGPIYQFDAGTAHRRFWPAIRRQAVAVLRSREQIRMLAAARYMSTHARTVIGTLWWYLDPFLQMLVYSFVVVVALQVPDIAVGAARRGPSDAAEAPIPYPVFLFCALIPFKWFASTLARSARAIIDGQGLLAKVRIDAIAFVFLHLFQELQHYLIGMGLVIAFAAWYGIHPGWALPALAAVAAVQFVLLAGLSLLVANACVFFRDVVNLLPTVLNVSMYLSPVLYAASQVPEDFRVVLDYNPLTVLIGAHRAVVLENRPPDAGPLLVLLGGSLVLLLAAAWLFDRQEGDFAKCL